MLIRRGRLKAKKVSSVWLIRPEDVKIVMKRKRGRPEKVVMNKTD